MENQFQPGEVVVLKTNNGPKMTIEKVNEDGTFKCHWMANNVSYREDFSESLIKKYEPTPFSGGATIRNSSNRW